MTRTARFAVALAALAVLAVLGGAAVTVAAYTARDRAGAARTPMTDPPSTPRVGLEDGQPLRGDHGRAAFEVPPSREGWTRQARDMVLYYLDRHGQASVGVRGAALYRAGYCRGRADSNRAFAGFARSVAEGSVRAVNADLGRRWVRAIALDDDLSTSGPHTPLQTEDVMLADGTSAVRSSSRITVLRPGPCDAPAVDLDMVSLDTGGSVASLVMVRDAGAPGTLPEDEVDAILATLHRVRD